MLTKQFVYEALCWAQAWSGGEGWGSKCEKLVLVLKTFPCQWEDQMQKYNQ